MHISHIYDVYLTDMNVFVVLGVRFIFYVL